jgi:hypothetical protein
MIRTSKTLTAVNFQEVVHSVRAGNADVARRQRFAGYRMDMHKTARLTPKVERHGPCGRRWRAQQCRCRPPVQHHPKTAAKWVRRERVVEVCRWLDNYRKLKEAIEAICELNHDLLRPDLAAPKGGRKKRD